MSAIDDIIAREQARVRSAAEAVIRQREATIASYRPAPAPVVTPPPGSYVVDNFPPIDEQPPLTLPPAIVLPPDVADDIPIVAAVADDTQPTPAAERVYLLPPIPLSPIDDEWFNVADETQTLTGSSRGNEEDARRAGGEIPRTLHEADDPFFDGGKKAPRKKTRDKKTRHKKSSASRKPSPKASPKKKASKKQRAKKRQPAWERAA